MQSDIHLLKLRHIIVSPLRLMTHGIAQVSTMPHDRVFARKKHKPDVDDGPEMSQSSSNRFLRSYK